MRFWGYRGGGEGQKCFSQKFNQIWCVRYLHEWHTQCTIFIFPSPRALRRSQKVKYHKISITESISKILKPNLMCLLTNERYKTYQMGFLFGPLGHASGFGTWGGGWGVQTSDFLNVIMWHIKLKGMSSRLGYIEKKQQPRIKLMTLGWSQRVKYH